MINISTSALAPSQYRQYVKGWNKERYADLFRKYTGDRNNFRIHIPLSKQGAKRINVAAIPEAIQKSVSEKGYMVEDYVTGIAVDSTGKRRIKIGKLLPPELQQLFANDKSRSNARNAAAGNQMVVISRHPYDVAGMSTDRGWVSCMHLVGGSNAKYVRDDINQGSIIAYLVNKDDINLQRPTARILMRVYRAENGKKGLFPSGVYGARSQPFFDTVRKWCSEVNVSYFGIPYGMTMELLETLYDDGIKHVVNDDYNPANALKELEHSLRTNPMRARAELDTFSARFGSHITEFYALANSIKSSKLDFSLSERSVRFMRIAVEDNLLSSDMKGAAEIAMRGYMANAPSFVTSDAIALIRVSELMGQKLLSVIDGIKIAAAIVATESDMSMSKVYVRLMDTEASRTLLDSAPKFGLTFEKALSLMIQDTHNNWHRVPLTPKENKLAKQLLVDDGVDELPVYYEAAFAAPAKCSAIFKRYIETLNASVVKGRTSGPDNSPNTLKLLIEKMPEDKWPAAFRGSYLLPLLVSSSYARDTNKQALEIMAPFLAKRTADYLKNDLKMGGRVLTWFTRLEGAMSGPHLAATFMRALPDVAWLEPAGMYLGCEALLTGSGGRAEIEAEYDLSSWIAESPIRVMAMANTETFAAGPFGQLMQAIVADMKSARTMVDNLRKAAKEVAGVKPVLRGLPLPLAASFVAEAKEEADENGESIATVLRRGYGSEFSPAAINLLLYSGLADI